MATSNNVIVDDKVMITCDWSMSGYHHFKVKPTVNDFTRFEREDDNPFDPNAILVKLKSGTTVGRVPANLCRFLRALKKEDNIITRSSCQYTGNVDHSTNPHFQTKFCKSSSSSGGMDKNGGGAVLHAVYRFECQRTNLGRFMELVDKHIPKDDRKRFSC